MPQWACASRTDFLWLGWQIHLVGGSCFPKFTRDWHRLSNPFEIWGKAQREHNNGECFPSTSFVSQCPMGDSFSFCPIHHWDSSISHPMTWRSPNLVFCIHCNALIRDVVFGVDIALSCGVFPILFSFQICWKCFGKHAPTGLCAAKIRLPFG